MSAVRHHPIITFFVLTYAIGWGCIPFWTFQAGSPLIAALIVIPLTQGWAGLRELGSRMIRWRVRWYWYVLAIGLPLAVLLLTAGLNVALGASAPSLASYGSVSTILLVFAVRLLNPGDGALGEEPGWRGFALPGLQGSGLSSGVHPHPRRACNRLACAHPLPGRGRLAAVYHRGLPPGNARGDVVVHVVVQPHGRQRAHDARVPRRPRDHHDRRALVLRRGLCAGQLAHWRRAERRGDRVGRLRLASLV